MWIIVEYITKEDKSYNIGLAATNEKLLLFIRRYVEECSGSGGSWREVPGMMSLDLDHIHKRMLPMVTGPSSDIYAQWIDPA